MASKPSIPCGAAVRGFVRGIVRALNSEPELDDQTYEECARELFKNSDHFNDDDMLAFFSLHHHFTEEYNDPIVRAYLKRGGAIDIALKCNPEVVTAVEIHASGMHATRVFESVAHGHGGMCRWYHLSTYWLSTLTPELRRRLLCFADESYIDRQGHADLVPAIAQAGHEIRELAEYRAKTDALVDELAALRAQLAWTKEGMKVVHFGSSTVATEARVPVYGKLLSEFAPGYFKNIVNISELQDGDSFEGPVCMHLRAQQAFAYAVEHCGKFGTNDQITIRDGALEALTFWEYKHLVELPHPGGSVVSPLVLDFTTAAELAAFCRAITFSPRDHSNGLYMHVARTYLASMRVHDSEHLETWCARVWPPDDVTVDLYEACAKADTFCFGETFDEEKQMALVMAVIKRKEALNKKRKDVPE